MYKAFISFIKQHRLLKDGQRVVMAVSGGLDSMVMVELFRQSSFPFALAHCNFQLRGAEADKDQAFVEQTASNLGVPVFTKQFDTRSVARKQNISIQMAARQLRYDWLEETRKMHGYDAVATAHHQDDAIETLLINITRGTGISGLKGIPRKNNNVIRPMLFATREAIEQFAKEKDLAWQEDRSNRETTYTRNKLRHQVIPTLKNINPSLSESLEDFFEKMEGVDTIYQAEIARQKKTCVQQKNEELHIMLLPLQQLPAPQTFLYECLKNYDFSSSTCRDIYDNLNNQAGKTFTSPTHTAFLDRQALIIVPNRSSASNLSDCVQITAETKKRSCGTYTISIKIGQMSEGPNLPAGPHCLMADLDKLSFPLTMEPWKAGDKLVPIGMTGHKKVSDLLTDTKIPLHQKREVMVLKSGEDIVWVPGIRADHRFRITNNTKRYFKACLL